MGEVVTAILCAFVSFTVAHFTVFNLAGNKHQGVWTALAVGILVFVIALALMLYAACSFGGSLQYESSRPSSSSVSQRTSTQSLLAPEHSPEKAHPIHSHATA